jgi:hypothetical protein
MQTKAIHFTSFGNAAIVHVSSEPLTSFPFMPPGPPQRGGLIISELTAWVPSASSPPSPQQMTTSCSPMPKFSPAKENRVVTRSVLLTPSAKTVIESHVLEHRWNYSPIIQHTRSWPTPICGAEAAPFHG